MNIYDITYMWKLKYDTNKTETDSQIQRIDLWLLSRRARGGKYWEFRISRCRLLYIVWINNEVQLYNTGNCIHYLVIKHNGKEQEKEYTCITASLPYSRNLHNMVNQIYFNKISRKRKKKGWCWTLAVAPICLRIPKPPHSTHGQGHLVTHLPPAQFHSRVSPTVADKSSFLLSTSRLLEWQDGITNREKNRASKSEREVGSFPYLPLTNCVILGKFLKGSVSSSVKPS